MFYKLNHNLYRSRLTHNFIKQKKTVARDAKESYTETVKSPEGKDVTITVKKISGDEPLITPYWAESSPKTVPMSGRHTYEISGNFNVVGWASFKVDIVDGYITRAYDGSYYFAVGSTANLSIDNGGNEANYNFDFATSLPWVNGPSWNGKLRARLGGFRLNSRTRVLYTEVL
ncbi:DUF5626 family protein [Atopococcus tabaci]|uniref:DUF5626 family protein n=1 Tax=Atopococcus tabaci TaxID=269774 RepID=UPI0004882648|nr:DUF5626 family protein [Atopococcus tabaci]